MLPTRNSPRRVRIAPRERRTTMHAGCWSWRDARRAFGNWDFGGWAGCGPEVFSWEWGGGAGQEGGFFGGGGAFGVRRPLRFLVHKLGLDEKQVPELARILDELKTERAQAEVDRRRTMSGFADAVQGEAFDQTRAKE